MASEITSVGSGDVNVIPATGQIYIMPVAFYVRAREFLEAGELLGDRAKAVTTVSAFLLCRAIELAFKAFLFARGRRLNEVRGLGHDLSACLLEAYAFGVDLVVPLSREAKEALAMINEEYLRHRLAYFEIESLLKPLSEDQRISLLDTAQHLVRSLERVCLDATDRDEWQWPPLPAE